MSILHGPFNDTQQPSIYRRVVNQSTDTTPFDAFRQGVELTHHKHYALGMLKIHAGFQETAGSHTVPTLVYGQTQLTLLDELYHRDVVPLEPKDYVGLVLPSGSVVFNGSVDLDVDPSVTDGVIEALDIRRVVSLRQNPRDSEHRLCGATTDGNELNRDSADNVVFVAIRKDLNYSARPMIDVVNAYTGLTTSGASLSSVDSRAAPFVDLYPPRGVQTSTRMENDMVVALNAAAPGSVNLRPSTHVQPGAAGFSWFEY